MRAVLSFIGVFIFSAFLMFLMFDYANYDETKNQVPEVAGVSTFNYQKTGDEFIDSINQIRVESGVKPLVLSDDLVKVADLRNTDMVNRKYYSHTNPDGLTFNAYFQTDHGYSCENLNLSESITALDSVKAWLDSDSGHRECVLNESVSFIGYSHSEVKDLTGSYITTLILASK